MSVNCIHYKNYVGNVEFSEADGVFHGKVIGIKPLLSFEGDSVYALVEDFHASVDEYMEFCSERGIKPEEPYSVSLNARAGVKLRRKAASARW